MIPQALALALLAAVCIGLVDYVYRAAGARVLAPNRWLLTQGGAFFAVTAIVALGAGTHVSPAMLYGLANGPINLAAFHCVLAALSRGDALALAPVARLNFVVTAMLAAAVLGEPLHASRLVGLGLAVAAVVSVGGHYAKVGGDRRALGLALAAMALSGIAGLVFKLGLRAGATPVDLVLAQSIGFTALAGLLAARERPAAGPAPRASALACGALIACFYLSLTTAFTTADAVVVAPVAQLGFVLTAALAVWRLGERVTPRRAAALALAVGAVIALAWR